ncbi:MAG: PQQ-binding-like beta-propeller repeat protein [Desulfobacterales bacterium]|nr:PQQ-binding-like beta-propeller repeat protein [Desulfobacterales bacterium]
MQPYTDTPWKDRLFIGDYGYALAIEKQTGRELWYNSLPETGNGIVMLLYNDGLLYAGSKGNLIAVEPETGKMIWESKIIRGHDLKNLVTSLASDICIAAPSKGDPWEDRVFIGTYRHVLAIEKNSGRKLWSTGLPGHKFFPTVTVAVLYDDGMLYAGSRGKLFAVDPGSGEITWENSFKSLVHGHMCMTVANNDKHKKDRFFISALGQVLAIEKHTGHELWCADLPETGYGGYRSFATVLYDNGLLYAGSGGKVFAADPETGNIAWKKEMVKTVGKSGFRKAFRRFFSTQGTDISMAGNYGKNQLFIGVCGYAAAIDKQTGRESWRTSLPGVGKTLVTVLCEESFLYAASDKKLFAINTEKGKIMWEKALRYDYVNMATTENYSQINDLAAFRTQLEK